MTQSTGQRGTMTQPGWWGWSDRDRDLLRAAALMWPVPVVGAMLTLLTVPFLVTTDGVGYVVMADILQEGVFPQGWDFIREPGLPVVVLTTLFSWPGVEGYLAISGAMLGLAVASMGGVFFDLGRPWQRLVAGLLAISSSTFIVYGGSITQQPGLVLLLALVGLNVRLLQTAGSVQPWRFLTLAILGAAGLYYSFVFVGIVAVAAVLAAIVTVPRMRGIGAGRITVAVVSVAAVAVLPIAAYAPWYSIKSQNYVRAGSVADMATARMGDLGEGASGQFLRERLGSALTLLHLPGPASAVLPKGEIPSASADQIRNVSEDLLLARIGAQPVLTTPQCGIFNITAEEAMAVISSFPRGQFCQPIDATDFRSATSDASYDLGGLSSVIMLAGTVWALLRRRELLVVLAIPWAWVAMYAMGSPIDRYVLPVWPYKVVFSLVLVLMAATWVVSRIAAARHKGTRAGTEPADAAAEHPDQGAVAAGTD